ncbi:MAG TPA: hypothetical protein VEI27_00040 [Dehalococcoidales bacterium]|nr:hypothetical protein [Dehalococcoidales bacterium]
MKLVKYLLLIILLVGGLLVLNGCHSSTTTTISTTSSGPGSGAVINSDSIDTVQIQSITKQTNGHAWKLDVLIQSTQDVDSLPNPVAQNLHNTVSVYCDEDLSGFRANDIATCRIKYAGDVNIPGGIYLLMYNVVKQANPGGY